MSVYQNYLALRRVFKARNVELTPPGMVRETLRGLIRRFIRRCHRSQASLCSRLPIRNGDLFALSSFELNVEVG